jgi:plasmid stabilization system protein ParE
MQITWSIAAKNSYLNIIEQLFDTWNLTIIERFENQVNLLLHNLSFHNHICPKSIFKDLHKCVVNKHISLIYRLKNENSIEIVMLIFNKSDHVF